jgi:hypothetical protein
MRHLDDICDLYSFCARAHDMNVCRCPHLNLKGVPYDFVTNYLMLIECTSKVTYTLA